MRVATRIAIIKLVYGAIDTDLISDRPVGRFTFVLRQHRQKLLFDPVIEILAAFEACEP